MKINPIILFEAFGDVLKPRSLEDIYKEFHVAGPDELLWKIVQTGGWKNKQSHEDWYSTRKEGEYYSRDLYRDMMEFAFKNGADPLKNDAAILKMAASSRDRWLVLTVLLRKRFKYTKTQLNDALWEAVRGKNISGVISLIKSGADPLWDDDIMFMVLQKWKLKDVDYLIKHIKRLKAVDFDINNIVHDQTLLEYAMRRGRLDMARMLIARGARIGNRKGKLLDAAKIGDKKRISKSDAAEDHPFVKDLNLSNKSAKQTVWEKERRDSLVSSAREMINQEKKVSESPKKKTNESGFYPGIV